MRLEQFRKRFRVEGVFWRHFISWAVRNVADFLQPPILWLWTLLFFVLWTSGRRAALRNMRVIRPDAGAVRRTLLAFGVFWNVARTFTDTTSFSEQRLGLDWEVAGAEHLEALSSEHSGIVLTAHMGNYDLGALLFARDTGRRLSVVRAAEPDQESDAHARARREAAGRELGTIEFRDSGDDPAIELFHAIRSGSIVAIQGDRSVPHVAEIEMSMFGRAFRVPAGPFALAMATGVRLWPSFIIRRGTRFYRAVALPSIEVRRTGRDRDPGIRAAAEQWLAILEAVIRRFPDQWLTTIPVFGAEEPSPPRSAPELPEIDDIRRLSAWRSPRRARHAFSRALLRMAGGTSEGSELRRHHSLALVPGQNSTETNIVAAFAFFLAAALAASLGMRGGIVSGVAAAFVAPFLFWMIVPTFTSGVLFLLGKGTFAGVEAVQRRVAFTLMTGIAIALLFFHPIAAAAGVIWLTLLLLNTAVAGVEWLRGTDR